MTAGDAPAEFRGILDVHTMILADPTLAEAPKRIIAEQHCNAEWALTQQMNVLVEQFEEIEDSYLRERKADVVQVVERVLQRMVGAALPMSPSATALWCRLAMFRAMPREWSMPTEHWSRQALLTFTLTTTAKPHGIPCSRLRAGTGLRRP